MNFSEALAAKNMELEKLCNEAGISSSTMHKVISGISSLTKAQQEKVDNILSSEINWEQMYKGLTPGVNLNTMPEMTGLKQVKDKNLSVAYFKEGPLESPQYPKGLGNQEEDNNPLSMPKMKFDNK